MYNWFYQVIADMQIYNSDLSYNVYIYQSSKKMANASFVQCQMSDVIRYFSSHF